MSAYRDALAGLVALPDPMTCSLADFGRRLAYYLREEQEKPLPDNGLIALLCDAARLGDELRASGVQIVWAARELVAAMDSTVPGWRAETLGQTENGDAVNAAWDALVSAVEARD